MRDAAIFPFYHYCTEAVVFLLLCGKFQGSVTLKPAPNLNTKFPCFLADMATETLSCKCLNVTFNVSQFASPEGEGPVQEKSYNEADIGSIFTNPKPVLPENSDRCIKTVMPCLLTSQQHRNWKLYTCFNCKTTTHAVCNSKCSKVLVNTGELLDTAAQQNALSQQPKSFQLFGVFLSPKSALDVVPVKHSLKPSYVETVSDLKARAAKFLKSEKEQLEERIKDYETAQRALFKEMEDSVLDSRDHLENQIWAAFNESNEDNDSAYERSVEEISSVSTAPSTRGRCMILTQSSSVTCQAN